jgi:S1-C subfamily serine protease
MDPTFEGAEGGALPSFEGVGDPMDPDGAGGDGSGGGATATAARARRPTSPLPPGSAAAAAAAHAPPRPTPAVSENLRSVVKIFVTRIDPSFALPWQKNPQRSATGSGFVVDASQFQPIDDEGGSGGGGSKEDGKNDDKQQTQQRLYILTNAHVVANSVTVYVRRPGSAKKYAARVECVARQCDLALLSVQDKAFWGGAAAASAAPAPAEAAATAAAAATAGPGAGPKSLPPLKPLHFAARVPHVQEALVVAGYPTGGDALSLTSGIVSRVAMVRYSAYGRLIGVQS